MPVETCPSGVDSWGKVTVSPEVPVARAIWSGSLTFGMVTFPVKVFGATEAKDLSFHLLHKDCGARIRQARICPTHEREVSWDEIVRGYEYAKGQYVVLEEGDFEQLPLPSRQVVEVSAFVAAEAIDPIYYERTYYLEPDTRGEKPYALLVQALERRALAAIATIALRKKEQLCAVRAQGGRLVLETLYYADEVRPREGVDLSGVRVSEKELDMADTLVELLADDFDPAKYHDRYRDALSALIEDKLEGKAVTKAPPVATGKVLDLTEALRRSVAAVKGGKPAGKSSRTAAGRRTTRRRRVS